MPLVAVQNYVLILRLLSQVFCFYIMTRIERNRSDSPSGNQQLALPDGRLGRRHEGLDGYPQEADLLDTSLTGSRKVTVKNDFPRRETTGCCVAWDARVPANPIQMALWIIRLYFNVPLATMMLSYGVGIDRDGEVS